MSLFSVKDGGKQMTICEAIQRTDSLKQNAYTQENKIEWLSILDGRVKREIIDTHQNANSVNFNEYNKDTDLETILLIPAPYDDIYIKWLEAQIDYHNGEMGKYTNSKTMFNSAYTDFARYYNRTVMPTAKDFKYF